MTRKLSLHRASQCWQAVVGRSKACCTRVRDGWRWLTVAPLIEDDEDYKAACAWQRQLKPNPDATGYAKALDYAWRRQEQIESASETLDRKADNIVRNAGLVAGLFGLAINTIKIDYPILLIFSLVLFIVAIAIAALTCNPTSSTTSASVQDVIDDATDGHESDAWMAGSVACAIAGRAAVNNWKAQRIRWATYVFCLGLALFLVPLTMWGLGFGKVPPTQSPSKDIITGSVGR